MPMALQVTIITARNNAKKQDAAHEPECNHVEHTCETNYWNSLVRFHPVTVPMQCRHCGMWKRVECKVWSAECKVWSVECRVWSVECRVQSAVLSVKCGV